MPRKRATYTADQRADALELYRTDGPTAVADRMGIPKQTVASWAKAAGVGTVRNENAAARIDAARLRWEERRVDMAHRMGEIAAKALERVEHALDGEDPEGGPLYVPGAFGQPTLIHPADAKALATTMAILVDKAQLLTGGATGRREFTPAAQQATVDEAGDRALRLVAG